MSVDRLHEKIRKLKNPVVLDFSVDLDVIPDYLKDNTESKDRIYHKFCMEILNGMKDVVPAARFSFDHFAMLGESGLMTLSQLLAEAATLGYYVLLDGPGILTPLAAERCAEALLGSDSRYPCDGVVVCPYIGSDGIRPFLPYCGDGQKDLFAVVRSPNKSAAEMQDLLSGSRLVHSATAEMVVRSGEGLYAKNGYSRVCAAVSAGNAASIRTLRSQYNRLFLLVDGIDYPSGNLKNCSYAFDKFGYGAVISAGTCVLGAWKENGSDGSDHVEHAILAAERIKKNISRYITIL